MHHSTFACVGQVKNAVFEGNARAFALAARIEPVILRKRCKMRMFFLPNTIYGGFRTLCLIECAWQKREDYPVGLFSKFRAKNNDEGSVFNTGPILTPEQFAGVAPRANDAASVDSAPTVETVPAAAAAPVVPPVPVPPPVVAPTQSAPSAATLPTIEIPSVAATTPAATLANDAPRGKHARVNDLPQIDSVPTASAAAQAPAHAAKAEANASAGDDTLTFTVLEGEDSVEPPSFEDSFFAENGFDIPDDSKHGKHRGLKIAGISVAAALVIAYGAGVGVFSSHFYPNTTGAGIDLSMKTVDEASAALEANVVDYSLTVDGKDMNLVVQGDAIDFSLSGINLFLRFQGFHRESQHDRLVRACVGDTGRDVVLSVAEDRPGLVAGGRDTVGCFHGVDAVVQFGIEDISALPGNSDGILDALDFAGDGG